MKKFNITFYSIEDIVNFVNKASQCEFEIDVKYNNIIVDGKSIVGVASLGINKEVEIICHTEAVTMEDLIPNYTAA